MGCVRKTSYFENEFVRLQLINGIIHMSYASNTIITLDMAKVIVEERLRITGGIPRPILGDAREVVTVNRATMSFFAKDEKSLLFVSAIGILIRDKLQKFLGNVFLKIDRPVAPSKLFTQHEKALLWLQQFK